MQTVIGIDLGTQSLKVVFYDYQARVVVACESAALDLYQRDDGTAEQQAHWWVNALHQAMGKVDRQIRQTAVAIGVSGQQHGFVPLDSAGKVLAPVKLWCDTSTVVECTEIMHRFGSEQDCLEQVGNLVLPGYTASKIAWLKKNKPALYQQLDCVLLPHDYLNFHLTGERCMEAGDASGTGFMDVRTRTWSMDMVRAIDPSGKLAECLPDIRTENGFIGHLRAEVAKSLELPEGTPVAIGGGDNMMGAIGTGNVMIGAVTMSLGTSGTVYAYSDQPVIDPAGNIAAFCSSTGGWLPLMCTMNCTVTTELLRDLLEADISEFEALISHANRGSDGVITLPFFNGERTPNLPRAKACIIGLDGQNMRRENLLRSGVEGATYALRYGIDELRGLGIQTSEIVLTGGGVKSDKWRQIVADVCATPVTVFQQDEGASFGAAIQALCALEGADQRQMTELVRAHLTRAEDMCCEPRTSAVNSYKEAYAQYSAAVGAISALYE